MEFWQTLWNGTLMPLLIAAGLGGLVGFEREQTNRPAGLRTHILVSVGSALITQVSIDMYRVFAQPGVPADPGRIAAQIVSGIGFLGAGTIMREGASIRGLTTAASLWAVAGIGLAVGAGLYTHAAVAAVLIYVTLKFLPWIEHRYIGRGGYHNITVHVTDTPGRLGAIASRMGSFGANIKNVVMRSGPLPGMVQIEFYLRLPHRAELHDLVSELMTLEGVTAVQQED